MSLLFSRQCEYALQAVLYLALKSNGGMTSIKDLTSHVSIPPPFLSKILQHLVSKGLLVSLKGPTGGFALGMPAKDITLFHIVEAIDGIDFVDKCVMGFPECSPSNPCALHRGWTEVRDRIHEMLMTRNIDEMAKAMKKPEYEFVD